MIQTVKLIWKQKTAQGDPGRFEQIVARRGIDAKNRKRWKQELPKENQIRFIQTIMNKEDFLDEENSGNGIGPDDDGWLCKCLCRGIV